jgi:hypothetical protein
MSSAPPGVKPKKLFIISNAPSVDGPGKSRNLSNSDFRSLLESSRKRDDNEDDEDDGSQTVDRQQKKKNAKARSYEKWQAKKAALEQKVRMASIYVCVSSHASRRRPGTVTVPLSAAWKATQTMRYHL